MSMVRGAMGVVGTMLVGFFLIAAVVVGGFILYMWGANNYAQTHDMQTPHVSISDLQKIDLNATWDEVCSGKYAPEWQIICSQVDELPAISEIANWGDFLARFDG